MSRGMWVPPLELPESQLRIALARQRLERTGTITSDVLRFIARRAQQTAQPRKSFAGNSANVVNKRRRIR